MRVGRSFLGNQRKELVFFKLNSLAWSKILCHNDHRLRHSLRAYLASVQDRDHTLRDIFDICSTSSHIIIIHAQEHGSKLLRSHEYSVLCIHFLIFYDIFDGIIIIRIIKKHLMNIKDHSLFFSYILQGFLIKSFKLS